MGKALRSLLFASLLAPAAGPALEGVHVNRSAGAPPLAGLPPGVEVVDGFNDQAYAVGDFYRCRSSPRICVSTATNGETPRSVHAVLATATSFSRRVSR